jgi:hypothetical protein
LPGVLGRLLTFPLKATGGLLRLYVQGGKLAASLVRELLTSDTAARAAEQPPPRRPEPPPPPPAPPAPKTTEPEAIEPQHVSEEPELVAESADVEAADAGTAEVHVAEPWDGYRHMKAADIIGRVADATAEQLAVIELYEQTHRGRKSILTAVEKQLRMLANRP